MPPSNDKPARNAASGIMNILSGGAAAATPPVTPDPPAQLDAPDPPAADTGDTEQQTNALEPEKATKLVADEDKETKVELCSHCNASMMQHSSADPEKDGALHCDACGCCFKKGTRELRDGHNPCTFASA